MIIFIIVIIIIVIIIIVIIIIIIIIIISIDHYFVKRSQNILKKSMHKFFVNDLDHHKK